MQRVCCVAASTGLAARTRGRSMQTKQNEPALRGFVATVGEIRRLLETLSEAADEHFGLTPEEIHWGHVGDATWTRDQLKHVLAVLHGEEGK